ncbi:MAG: peptidylprolyl isomerase [Proteobacteria bacterium]|nr:peptidylprolyl isomerase [Pseudomonadota bacterium]
MPAWIKDPLVIFLLAGAALFALNAWWDADASDNLIEVTDAQINRLQDQWQAQMGREPTSEELNNLIDQFISEEVYYREAMRLNLDTNDTIIRRRLVQKLTFLTEDIATAVAPADETLQAYFAANAERYRLPLRVSFTHRYFSSDRRENAQADAGLAVADESIVGDPFMLQRSYAQRSLKQVEDQFGSAFADGVETLPVGVWAGPVQSAYGWHAVKLERLIESELPSYTSIENNVLSDWQRDQREAANSAYYESLLSRYEIRRP